MSAHDESGTRGDEATDSTPDLVPPNPPVEGEPERSSSADVITMCLFGAMVLIASVCFVIW